LENNTLYTSKEIELLSNISCLTIEQAYLFILLPSISKSDLNKYFVEEPLENMPLYISDHFKAYKNLAIWRLQIKK